MRKAESNEYPHHKIRTIRSHGTACWYQYLVTTVYGCHHDMNYLQNLFDEVESTLYIGGENPGIPHETAYFVNNMGKGDTYT